MSSATVLDSIIEGVRADVAAREAVVSMSEIKAAAEAMPSPLDVLAALREPGGMSPSRIFETLAPAADPLFCEVLANLQPHLEHEVGSR